MNVVTSANARTVQKRLFGMCIKTVWGYCPMWRALAKHQMMLNLMFRVIDINIHIAMRTTITIDDALLAKAAKLAGPLDRSAVVHEGLKALIERESARRLARLGGSQPGLKVAPRRRAPAKT